MSAAPVSRCPWPTSEFYLAYHDHEWGVPQHDDRVLFEFILLEGAQAGLSWSTILNKRETTGAHLTVSTRTRSRATVRGRSRPCSPTRASCATA